MPGEQGLGSFRLRRLLEFHFWFSDAVQLGREGVPCSSWRCSDVRLCVLTQLEMGAGDGSEPPGFRALLVMLQGPEADLSADALADSLLRLSPRLSECPSLSHKAHTLILSA